MKLADYYLRYCEAVGEGALAAPEGIALTENEPLRRAAELQTQIAAMGVPEFVRRCAALEGADIPQALYDAFCPEELMQALAGQAGAEQSESEPAETADDELTPPQIDEPDGPRSAYEVLLDCCFLEEPLFRYLVDVLRRGADDEFQKLALVTARKAFTQADFLYWFATKQERAPQDELICVTVMDACLDRLAQEGQNELIAALLCGDQKTFELFRCEAPELVHLPQATFAWYEENYLKGYYGIRYMLKFHHIAFPKEALQ
mgnify:CR=1 FL=1